MATYAQLHTHAHIELAMRGHPEIMLRSVPQIVDAYHQKVLDDTEPSAFWFGLIKGALKSALRLGKKFRI